MDYIWLLLVLGVILVGVVYFNARKESIWDLDFRTPWDPRNGHPDGDDPQE